MEISKRWQDAYVGRIGGLAAFRATEEELQRLEELRKHHRLTSKGQVLRLALDVLELTATPGYLLGGGMEGLKDLHSQAAEMRELIQERFTADAEGAAVDRGLSATTPPSEEQD